MERAESGVCAKARRQVWPPSRSAIACVAILALAPSGAATAEPPYAVAWSAQIGTGTWDYGFSVAVDAWGNAYIGGTTEGSLGGANAGASDAFLAKYDASGGLLWSTQIGTGSWDYGCSVGVDAWGNAFITGRTEGSLGGTSAGGSDAFLVKCDSSGTLLWSRQLGTSYGDFSLSVAVDAWGNAFISGGTEGSLGGAYAGGGDAFLAKYDASGGLLWSRQIGTNSWEESTSVAVDVWGNAYISGSTSGSLGGPNTGFVDAFLAKYDASGVLLWSSQLGASYHEFTLSYSVAVDASGNAYLTGFTWGGLSGPNAGGGDAFLAKYDASGGLLWCRQIGTSEVDWGKCVAVDAWGNAYISGTTDGILGETSAGPGDAFLAKYDASGDLLWCKQIGTSAYDSSNSVAVDAWGNAYISGTTDGSLGGPNAGWSDAFLVKLEVPEPATLSLLALGACLPLLRRRR